MRAQLLARSMETKSPVSVPRYNTSAFLVSSVKVRATSPFRFATTDVHVWPKSWLT